MMRAARSLGLGVGFFSAVDFSIKQHEGCEFYELLSGQVQANGKPVVLDLFLNNVQCEQTPNYRSKL